MIAAKSVLRLPVTARELSLARYETLAQGTFDCSCDYLVCQAATHTLNSKTKG